MPGRLFLTASAADLARHFGCPLPDEPEQRRNIAPGQDILVFDGAALRPMRWGILPVGRKNARGRPVMETLINARSETVFEKSAYDGARPGLVPASGWYEWTGERRRKIPWQIAPTCGGLLTFAAIWDVWVAPGGAELAQVATLTCPPNGDVRDIHDRMGVLLDPADFSTYLTGSARAAKALLRPLQDGRLTITKNPDVNWEAA
ncbi:MAG: SOS response-associated peptidase [Pseudomonadota bacterium]